MSKPQGHFRFLGTSGSMGIPVIGCHCAVCQSESPCNQRTRTSGLISIGNKKLLIDCGPDFRMQALRYHIESLDGLLLTHTHHDHIAGVDELRVYYMVHKVPMPCLLSEESSIDLKTRYNYIFDEPMKNKMTTRMSFQVLKGHRGITDFLGVKIQYVTYEQGGMLVNGYRLGNFAYISDIKNYPETLFDDLKGVEILVVSALRETSSPMHFRIDEAVQFSKRVGASQTWLTHIAHELDHETTNARLPPNIRMAYDGLELSFIGG